MSNGSPVSTRTGSKAISASPWCQAPISATSRSRPRNLRNTSTGDRSRSSRVRCTDGIEGSVGAGVVNDLGTQLAGEQLFGIGQSVIGDLVVDTRIGVGITLGLDRLAEPVTDR